MSPSIASYSLVERFKLARALSRNPYEARGAYMALYEYLRAIEKLKAAVQSKPREWVYWYALCDFYQAVGELAESIKAGQECYELRPNDPRSAFALAAAFNVLTHARWVDAPPWIIDDDFSPIRSLTALGELGMTVDQAAEKAIVLFENVLNLGVRGQEASLVKDTLAQLYSAFPQLGKK